MIGVGLAETRSAVALSLILRRRGWLSLAIEHLVVRGRLVEVREHHDRLGGGQMRASLRRRGGRGSRVLATAPQATVPTIASPIAPPTCCPTLTRPEATPVSLLSTLDQPDEEDQHEQRPQAGPGEQFWAERHHRRPMVTHIARPDQDVL